MSALVNAEQAKQLKEAGYDVPVLSYLYYEEKNLLHESDHYLTENYNAVYNPPYHYMSRPTLHEAAEWVRSKKLHIMILPDSTDNDADTLKIIWSAVIYRIHNRLNPQPMIVREGVFTKYFDTHDTALSAGISAALLIYKEQGK